MMMKLQRHGMQHSILHSDRFHGLLLYFLKAFNPKAFWILVCFNLLFLVFSFVFRENIKTDFNQMNDNLNEKRILIACISAFKNYG